MKVLLDENIPHDLRPFLSHHETFTAAYMGWAGLTNGGLLDSAEKEGFDERCHEPMSAYYRSSVCTWVSIGRVIHGSIVCPRPTALGLHGTNTPANTLSVRCAL